MLFSNFLRESPADALGPKMAIAFSAEYAKRGVLSLR